MPENKYEVRGYRGCEFFDCPQKSRKSDGGFLKNFIFYFNGPFQKFPSSDELKTAVILGEATVADTLDEFSSLIKDAPKKTFFIINDKEDTKTVVPSFDKYIHMPINELVDKMANLRNIYYTH